MVWLNAPKFNPTEFHLSSCLSKSMWMEETVGTETMWCHIEFDRFTFFVRFNDDFKVILN